MIGHLQLELIFLGEKHLLLSHVSKS